MLFTRIGFSKLSTTPSSWHKIGTKIDYHTSSQQAGRSGAAEGVVRLLNSEKNSKYNSLSIDTSQSTWKAPVFLNCFLTLFCLVIIDVVCGQPLFNYSTVSQAAPLTLVVLRRRKKRRSVYVWLKMQHQQKPRLSIQNCNSLVLLFSLEYNLSV